MSEIFEQDPEMDNYGLLNFYKEKESWNDRT